MRDWWWALVLGALMWSTSAWAQCQTGYKPCATGCIPNAGTCCSGGGYCSGTTPVCTNGSCCPSSSPYYCSNTNDCRTSSSACNVTSSCGTNEYECGSGYCTPVGRVCCASVGRPDVNCPSGTSCTSSGGCTSGSGGGGGTTGNCAVGEEQCGSSWCIPAGDVCCASVGFPSKYCPAGARCTSSGTCSTSSPTGGGSGSGGGSGGGSGARREGTPSWGCSASGLEVSMLVLSVVLLRRRRS